MLSLLDEYWEMFKKTEKRCKFNKQWKALKKGCSKIGELFPYTIEEIVRMDFNGLIKIYITYIEDFIPWIDSLTRSDPQKAMFITKRIKHIFDYKRKENKIKQFFRKHAEELDLQTCHYCDIIPIYTYEDKGEVKGQFALDHVLDWSDCPLVAYSLMNFVASCTTCNTNQKGTKILGASYPSPPATPVLDAEKMNKLSPTSNVYDFDNNIQIDIEPHNIRKENFHENFSKYRIAFITPPSCDSTYQESVTMFALAQRYNDRSIKEPILELMDDLQNNPKTKREENAKMLGETLNEYEHKLFGSVYYKYSKRKLYSDIIRKYKQD